MPKRDSVVAGGWAGSVCFEFVEGNRRSFGRWRLHGRGVLVGARAERSDAGP